MTQPHLGVISAMHTVYLWMSRESLHQWYVFNPHTLVQYRSTFVHMCTEAKIISMRQRTMWQCVLMHKYKYTRRHILMLGYTVFFSIRSAKIWFRVRLLKNFGFFSTSTIINHHQYSNSALVSVTCLTTLRKAHPKGASDPLGSGDHHRPGGPPRGGARAARSYRAASYRKWHA